MEGRLKKSPLIASGLLLGAGLGGFFDGILFHQILQFHNMLSARIPVTDLVSAKVNMVWDGYFHAGVWALTCIGLYLLFRAGLRRDVPWSGKVLSGSLCAGWGAFNLIEGILDHGILGLHHVYEYTADHLPADLAFLVSGVLLVGVGWALIRAGDHKASPRGAGPLAP